MASAYFYPRSPCGERRTPNLYTTKCTDISIHALLAESDGASFVMSLFYINFYPRSPCGERRPRCAGIWFAACNFYPRSPCGERPITPVTGLFWQKFLSTLSLRRATLKSSISTKSALFLSTLSLRRATTGKVVKYSGWLISIHALLAESDSIAKATSCTIPISIHALLAESDRWYIIKSYIIFYFYPRSPCGERR